MRTYIYDKNSLKTLYMVQPALDHYVEPRTETSPCRDTCMNIVGLKIQLHNIKLFSRIGQSQALEHSISSVMTERNRTYNR